ncbi:YeeE/YedE family protein [Naumannella halotolerans]|uniref:YeeE/YedE family protein n=1 Tax=Naumannella halotolerans TaxID=993414 RepID=UPI00370DDD29
MTSVAPSRWPAPAPTCAVPPAPETAGRTQWLPLAIYLLLAAGLVGFVGIQHGAKAAVLLLLGLGLGLALFHSRFGFTSAWRQLVAVGNGEGLRAHTVLLGATATVFALLIGTGTGLFGSTPEPSAGTLGVGLLLGAFLFGIGMQLGGACASGTLFAVGSGQNTILFTLFGFIAGSVIFTAIYPWVADLPALPPILLSDSVGWFGSWVVTIAALLAVYVLARLVQARRNPPPTGRPPTARGLARIVRGAWPLWVGALVLALLGGGVMLVSGGAWGVTSGFALWGARVLQLFGLQPETWQYWQQAGPAKQLAGPILADKTSLTNLGIILGAGVAATAGGVWVFRQRIQWNVALVSILGGVLMGIGARLASGCNIGAYLAGIASGSVSGWVWGLVALAGTWVGLRARGWFGLSVPKPSDSVC